LIPWARVSLKK